MLASESARFRPDDIWLLLRMIQHKIVYTKTQRFAVVIQRTGDGWREKRQLILAFADSRSRRATVRRLCCVRPSVVANESMLEGDVLFSRAGRREDTHTRQGRSKQALAPTMSNWPQQKVLAIRPLFVRSLFTSLAGRLLQWTAI